VLAPGELAVAQTDLTQGAEVVGRVIRVPPSDAFETLVASLDLLIVRPRGALQPEYLYGLLRQDAFREHCRRHTSGTTVLHLASDALARYDVPFVSEADQLAFAQDARPILKLVDTLTRQDATLTSLRDALLPELLSGRLRVPEALEQIEAVV
jgi:type I restriction enzyme S subunit